MPILIIAGPIFYSQLDEKLFFEGMHSLTGIVGVKGVGRYLQIETRGRLRAKAQQEFESLLRRYRVKVKKKKPNQSLGPTRGKAVPRINDRIVTTLKK